MHISTLQYTAVFTRDATLWGLFEQCLVEVAALRDQAQVLEEEGDGLSAAVHDMQVPWMLGRVQSRVQTSHLGPDPSP